MGQGSSGQQGPIMNPKTFGKAEDIEKPQVATFGAGCYWGTEKYFRKDFASKYPGAILRTAVGFMGGKKENPTYREVCSGRSGHVEVLQVSFDESKASYEDLCKFFFTFHDPTTPNRQGNDAGTQYASVIFTHTEEQQKTATKVKALVDKLIDNGTINVFSEDSCSTGIVPFPANKFFEAHEEHQQYLAKNPGGYCNHRKRFEWP